MSGIFPSSGGPQQPLGPADGAGPQELRLGVRSTTLGHGTLACPSCDAPVTPPQYPAAISTQLSCSWCDRSGPLRDFLSLSTPTRPTRVVVRVHLPEHGGGQRLSVEPRRPD